MKKIILSIALLFPVFLFAQKEYTFITHRGVVKDGYNFWLSVPDTYEAQQEKMPVVLFLHGASLCGNDLSRVRRYGCLHAISMGRDIDALVVAPQNPGGAWNPQRIMAVLDWVKEHYALDTNRLYVLGMSLGGYGTFDFTATYPDKIAASMALCGGSSRKDFCGLNRVPLWIIHGTADRDVPLSRSQVIVDAMKACDKVCFTVLGEEEVRSPEEAWAPHVKSVVVFGRCHVVEDPEEFHTLLKTFAMKYYPTEQMVDDEIRASGKHAAMYKISIEHFSGKEVQEN